MERWDEDGGGTACSEYVGPGPLVQIVVYIINIAAIKVDVKLIQLDLYRCSVPGTGNELNYGSKEKESAVESQSHIPPVLPQQPIQHFKPLFFIFHSN